MIHLLNALLCSKVIRDAEKNTISIIEIVENITFDSGITDKQFITPIDLDLFTQWARENPEIPVESTFRINYLLPDGEISELKQIPINLSKYFFYRATLHLKNLKINGPGLYHFLIEIKTTNSEWQELQRIPFRVQLKENKEKSD